MNIYRPGLLRITVIISSLTVNVSRKEAFFCENDIKRTTVCTAIEDVRSVVGAGSKCNTPITRYGDTSERYVRC